MKYMRIVARSRYNVHIQITDDKRVGFKQKIISHEEFFDLMLHEFPNYFDDFVAAKKEEFTDLMESCVRFFYHYGESRDMIRSGEAYIFEREGC